MRVLINDGVFDLLTWHQTRNGNVAVKPGELFDER
jgi:hypothetical protein